MCAVCWSGAQIIPASAAAWRYWKVNQDALRAKWSRRSRPSVSATAGELVVAGEARRTGDLVGSPAPAEPAGCDCGHAHGDASEVNRLVRLDEGQRTPVPVGG